MNAKTTRKPNVLFLCTGNSCRSQMAEGFARKLLGDRITALSAGVEPHGMNKLAMRVMAEAGVPIDQQHSKHVRELDVTIDVIISVCGKADQACPTLPGPARRVHRPFDDPPALARAARDEDEALGHYRRVRDEIRRYVQHQLPLDLNLSHGAHDMNRETLTQAVRQKYGQTAASGLDNNAAGVQAVAEAFGYSAQELTSIPAEANMGLSCGNPIATAHLKPGEVVVDLGSGGGLDVFLASAKVGPTGKAIGVDMTPQMLERARNAAAKGNYANVQFLLGTIDNLPLPDASADVIISNCVINLAPDKPAVFREMMRVLKPGGRVAVSDIVIKKPLPEALARDVMAYVGCIAGAIPVSEYEAGLKAAGFQNVVVVDSGRDLNAYSQVEGQSACCSPASETPAQPASSSSGCCSGESKASLPVANQPASSGGGCCSGESDKPSRSGHEVKAGVHEHLSDLMSRYNVNDYAASVKVFALKPH